MTFEKVITQKLQFEYVNIFITVWLFGHINSNEFEIQYMFCLESLVSTNESFHFDTFTFYLHACASRMKSNLELLRFEI